VSELRKCGIAFDGALWLRSFIEQGAPVAKGNGSDVQRVYIRRALNELVAGFGSVQTAVENRDLSLRNWMILIANLRLAGPEVLGESIEPMLRAMEGSEWMTLIGKSDLRNIGGLAAAFHPDGGVFRWLPSIPHDYLPDFDALAAGASLLELAHALYSFRWISRPDWCKALSDVVDRQVSSIAERVRAATLGQVDFFLWNLLTARERLGPPSILNTQAFTDALQSIIKPAQQSRCLGLCGTLRLWGVADVNKLVSSPINPAFAFERCLELAQRPSFELIRCTSGMLTTVSRPDPSWARALSPALKQLASNADAGSREAAQRVLEWLE